MKKPGRNRKDLLKIFKHLKRPLILDGAVGSLLQQMGVESKSSMWTSIAIINSPYSVLQVHKEYIKAGAEIITTNTFRTNPHAVELSGKTFSSRNLVQKSIELVIKAAMGKEIIIAGSNAPAEDCYQVERTISKMKLEYNHKNHIDYLWESGVDFILNETQSHRDEIEIICKHCSLNEIPFVLSLYITNDMKLLSGESLSEAVELIKDYKPAAIGINCIHPNVLRNYSFDNEFNFGLYFNCGSGEPTDERIECAISPNDYIDQIEPLIKDNTIFVGGCCGSTPEHIKIIKEYLIELYRN
ncbi:MAG: homocysteine S-methyltransferase family protein [Melioribacteraceae bacterium]|nr:homocysteine S-methyltransferase family protein [Melioribacteraceae bacterium]MCF8352870.1 homocysteine S-methyltransferase family protein [Melioribacteraceae bacterium]MCF8393813.1 homocysteine S-methyltransferase family protein [Melioribacteraceae bacterium]MCF8417387.1 homocysteine S-methyltransferase family protein [Melioribacteraceae bacterium]